MLTGQRPGTRRRSRETRRAARIAVPVAITVAVGAVIGVVFVVSNNGTTSVNQSAFGRHHHGGTTATATATATGTANATTSATPTTTATGATAAVPPANSFASGQVATQQLGDVATKPVSGAAGATPINLKQTPAEAANSMNCTIAVPANPLSAKGLATPWQLGDGCSMANAATEGAFVEATILAPNGTLQVYNPLVITAGTTAAVTPTAPTITPGSVVEISVGFNGTNLALTGNGARQGNCVDADGQSLIGQVSACNAVNFYNTANRDIANGRLKVAPVGTATDGQACETTRDFALIDQDQSDNVVTGYLINGNGQTAQNTAANKAANPNDTLLVNGSDDKLIDAFVDPANGCTPFSATDTTDPTGMSGSQALNELSARVNQQGTIAVVPPNDEMVLVNGNMSIAKTNIYRSLVDQPLLANNTNTTTVAASYCQNMTNIAPARDNLDMAKDALFTTPVAAVGSNLATFLGNRLSMSFVNLNCANFGLANPVNVTLNGQGVATAVTYNLAQQTAKGAATTTTNPTKGQTTGTQSKGGRRNYGQNPSGM